MKTVRIVYEQKNSFQAEVYLTSPAGDVEGPYTTENIQDFALFRPMGLTTIADKPVFHEFCPLNA